MDSVYIITLLISSTFFVGVISKCDEGWMPSVGNTCLKLSDTKASWPDAKKICQSLEGDLVTLETKSKEVFFEGWLVSQRKQGWRLWVGAHEPTNGVWMWDGLYKGHFETDGWKKGEPNNRGNKENCMEVFRSAMHWNDENCNDRSLFVCEKWEFEQ